MPLIALTTSLTVNSIVGFLPYLVAERCYVQRDDNGYEALCFSPLVTLRYKSCPSGTKTASVLNAPNVAIVVLDRLGLCGLQMKRGGGWRKNLVLE